MYDLLTKLNEFSRIFRDHVVLFAFFAETFSYFTQTATADIYRSACSFHKLSSQEDIQVQMRSTFSAICFSVSEISSTIRSRSNVSLASSRQTCMISASLFSWIFFRGYLRSASLFQRALWSVRRTTTRSNSSLKNSSQECQSNMQPPLCNRGCRWSRSCRKY